MNAKKLIPVAGLVVAGLIGAAEACYYETSYICLYANAPVGSYSSSCWATVYASCDWNSWQNWYTSGGEVLDYDNPQYCSGPAYFTDCMSSQTVHLDNVTDGSTAATYRVAYGQGCH